MKGGKGDYKKKKSKAKSKKETKSKRDYKKYDNPNKNKSLVSLGLGFPKKMMATLKYRQYVYMSSTLGVLNSYNFSANGMTTVYLTGGGGAHQPMYFDEYTAIYNHYHVIGSRIKVTLVSQNGDNSTNTPIAFGIFLNDDTSNPSTSYTGFSEQTLGKLRILGSNNVDDRQVCTSKYSAKKTFGKEILSNNSLQGTSLANPTEVQAYTIFIQSLDQTSTTACYAWIEIEYIAIFAELKDFAQS